jgi:cytochrome P450
VAPERSRSLTDRQRDGHSHPVALIESAEATTGRLGAVLRAPRSAGLTRLDEGGPWLATSLETAKRVLMDAAAFDFPTNVSRGRDMSVSSADTRTGHHVYAPVSPSQVAAGREVFLAEWGNALAGTGTLDQGSFEAMELLRRPVARATCAAVLEDLDPKSRDEVADQVLAWIDALGPVISSRRSPGRWSRARRGERRARLDLEDSLATALHALGIGEAPPVVANMLAAGVQVPIAAGAWLLVFLAAHPDQELDLDDAVWESLRMAPPTWVTARVTTAPVDLAGHSLLAGELVLVSPLLLGRLARLVPGTVEDLGSFDPGRWRSDGIRPGAWLPFGAGAHACPGRNLGLGLLHDLAAWARRHDLTLTRPVAIDQSRGILPSPAHIAFSSPTQ